MDQTKVLITEIRVERSNPLIYRELLLPADTMAGDLLAAVCISIGCDSAEGHILKDEEEITDPALPVAQFLHEGDHLQILLSPKDTKAKRTSAPLSLILTVIAEKDAGAEKPPFPVVTSGYGLQLPEGVWDIGEINAIHQALLQTEAVQAGKNTYFFKHALLLDRSKAENAMRRHFAPETANPELNGKNGVPMEVLLTRTKLEDLKYLVDYYQIYRDSSMRKPDLIRALCRKYDRDFLKGLFEKMTLEEFLNFQDFATSEDPDDEVDWADALDLLYNLGLLEIMPKEGWKVASELLDYYAEWYGTEAETAFLLDKTAKNAMLAAGRLYGIVSRQEFHAVLQLIPDNALSPEQADDYYDRLVSGRIHLPFEPLTDGLLRYTEVINARDAATVHRLQPAPDIFFQPGQQLLEKLLKQDVNFSVDGGGELMTFIKQFSYTGYYYHDRSDNARDIYTDALHLLRQAGDVDKTLELIRSKLYRLSWISNSQSILDNIRQILLDERDDLPLMALNGYSMNNAPADVKKRFLEQQWAIELEEEEKKERKAAKRRRGKK
ncbi:MAG: hypothetical protein IJT34_03340 [Butyrivibrio sp.]|nr:hypothetical protein [Butyrivibrio sp.]